MKNTFRFIIELVLIFGLYAILIFRSGEKPAEPAAVYVSVPAEEKPAEEIRYYSAMADYYTELARGYAEYLDAEPLH